VLVLEPILRAISVNKAFFLGETIYAVNNVNLAVEPGEFIVIMGPSGSGKSTLLSLLGGLDRPISGEIVLDGARYSALGENGLASLRREKLGFVFQAFNLIPHLTAMENVALPLRFTGKHISSIHDRASQLLDQVGLSGRKRHKPLEMSGGEQQRVAIARALANNPRVVLADEPTGNLDSRTSQEIAQLFKTFNRIESQTFVVVSHDESMTQYADRVVFMRDGKIASIEDRRGA
jgi:putative ABC transport system ATP-binding protein